MDKISIIIPVHNGGKYLNRLYSNINQQSYKNLEIIFVENFSADNSKDILINLSQLDSRIIVLESKKRGTSFARKKGVEHATGKYTVFMDQDDRYLNKHALASMYESIVMTNAQMVQFGYYKEYSLGVLRKISFTKEACLLSSDEVRKTTIASLMGGEGLIFFSVWSKIFLTDILKDGVKLVDIPLYFAEDLFLNVCVLTSPKLQKVCIDPSAYYAWKTNTGFSSQRNSGFALIEDYKLAKPRINDILISFNSDESVFTRLHMESLYFIKEFLIDKTQCVATKENKELVEEMNRMNFVIDAKNYFNHTLSKEKLFDDLLFLSSDYSAEEFFKKYAHTTKPKYKMMLKFQKMFKK